MNRREFFKFPAVIALMVAVPPLAKSDPRLSGFVREILQYHPLYGVYIFRWDIGDGKNQYHVEGFCNNEDYLTKEEFLIDARDEAIGKLKDLAETQGMDLSNLIKLDMPIGIEHGRYI